MTRPTLRHLFLPLAFALAANRSHAQTTPGPDPAVAQYHLSASVDEVTLTFHAADANGLPINDLKLTDLTLRDNGQPPRRIVAFEPMQNFPIRAGILIDTSPSMQPSLAANRTIAAQYAQHLLRQSTDQAFIMDFGYSANTLQPWTSDPTALAASISRIRAGRENPLEGTALFDTIYKACFYEFGKANPNASGNVILLFTDGEDNASHTTLEQTIEICQRRSMAIYAFHTEPAVPSSGPENLNQLTAKTGGQVFFSDDTTEVINTHLSQIEANLRNQYRLIYNPTELRHNGQFHTIQIQSSRAETIQTRTGYYAPSH